MNETGATLPARWLPLGLIALSGLLIAHHVMEFVAVLREGAGKAALTLDFRTYMCGAANLSTPYDICHNGEFVSGFVYPPPSLVYFNLLSRLPIDTAFLIHTALCLTVLAMAAWMAVRLAGGPRLAIAAALLGALAIAPIGTSLAAGQVNILLMGAAVAGMYCAARGRASGAGIAIALGFWLKIYPGLVPALFLTPRKWRAALATVIASAAIALLGLLWAAPGLYAQYFLELLPHAQGYTMPGVAQSLAGIATHIEAGGGQPVLHFVPIPQTIQLASKALLAFGILAAMAHQAITRESRPLDSLNLLLCASLVAAPNAWGYHYALIFPVILAAVAQTLGNPNPLRTPMVLACWMALVIPAWTDPPHLLAQYPILNVPFRGRYALVAVVLAALIAWDARKGEIAAAPRRR
ncbi:mannosyltransferase [Sphingomonas sp. LH128]|uniref:glycosyltransferase family 87 protein n=1 Tax=Sphingomonas sp. LH128 TaxID=473781 RepID=UPI00027C9F9F|nr:glycosyltransferase family 87 protein [Sphingomonas sp. LH128]EJU11674.1 mannosyltransferase [Sphingomonas sp. LH128]